MSVPAESATVLEHIKLVLMEDINTVMTARYGTYYVAARELNMDEKSLYRVNKRQHALVSIPWLLELSGQLGITVTIKSVYTLSEPRPPL